MAWMGMRRDGLSCIADRSHKRDCFTTKPGASLPIVGLLKLIFLIQCLLLATLSPSPAKAQSAIAGQAVLEDPTNGLGFADIRTKDFVPYSGIYNRGFSQSTFWFRLDLDPALAQSPAGGFGNNLFVLRILPSFIDEIEVFDPLQTDGKQRVTGTRFSGKGDEYKSLNFNFVIQQLDQPRPIWLKLKTNTSTIILFELLHLPTLTQADQQQTLFYGIYLGVIVLTLLLALLIFKINQDKIVLVFGIKQFSTILWVFFDRGFYRLMFDEMAEPFSITEARLYMSFVVVLASLYFDYVFLKEFKSSKAAQLFQRVTMGAVVLTCALYLAGHYALGIKINMIAVTAGIISSWFIAMTLPQSELLADPQTRTVPKYTIVLSYSIVIILLLPAVLPLIGIVPATSLTLNALLYHGLLSSIALASVLGLRARAMHMRQIELQNALEISQRLAEEEHQNRIEQSKFMAMLSHELKTSLAGIKMVAATEHANGRSQQLIADAVDDIDHIIERCLHAERILEGSVTLHGDTIDISDLLNMLCQRHSQANRIDVTCADLPIIRSDLQLLKVILSNLIDNACKYSAPETRVTIRADVISHGGMRQIQMSCANIPIHQDWPDPNKLFSKYYRSQIAHRITGSGLGLYLASQFARMLGGTIAYTPNDRDVVFTLTIPVSY